MTMRTALILAGALALSACSQPAADDAATEAAGDTAAADSTTGAGADASVQAASLTPEQADQAFRCNALFTAVVAGRIGGQMEPLPADLDGAVRTSGAAFWNDREQAAIAALGLTPEEATARVAQAAEGVVGRRTLSEQDLVDLRGCVDAMG
ncbi:MAG: hypothetical protein J0L52_00195 [Caulobacterales bacterium]|nr:hypothetical protein [Caulobacterales bacterium]